MAACLLEIASTGRATSGHPFAIFSGDMTGSEGVISNTLKEANNEMLTLWKREG